MCILLSFCVRILEAASTVSGTRFPISTLGRFRHVPARFSADEGTSCPHASSSSEQDDWVDVGGNGLGCIQPTNYASWGVTSRYTNGLSSFAGTGNQKRLAESDRIPKSGFSKGNEQPGRHSEVQSPHPSKKGSLQSCRREEPPRKATKTSFRNTTNQGRRRGNRGEQTQDPRNHPQKSQQSLRPPCRRRETGWA